MKWLIVVSFLIGSYSNAQSQDIECPQLKVIEIGEVPPLATKEVNPAQYEAATLVSKGTRFFFLTRKLDGIGREHFRKAVCKAWPQWTRLFQINVPHISFIDYDMAIGGGSFSDFVLGVYLGGRVQPDIKQVVNQMLGWLPQPTFRQYIENNYSGFTDPMQAYVDDIVMHELGHLLFGFGKTKNPPDERMWFSLGLGLVYDRQIWSAIHAKPSPLFESTVKIWRDRFSWRDDIDQRLVEPDTSQDQKAGLIRTQTYDHGKSLVYLSTLRNRLGETRFDELVREYLNRPYGSTIQYDDFLSRLTDDEMSIVRAAESELLVR